MDSKLSSGMLLLALVAAVASMATPKTTANGICKNTSNNLCLCELADGSKIDLTPFEKINEMTAPRKSKGGKFYFNPCYPYNPGTPFSSCRKNVLLCLKRPGWDSNIVIAAEQTAKFTKSGEDYVLSYSTLDSKITSEVTLKCDRDGEKGKFMETEESNGDNYKFELRSKFACVQGPSATTTTKATTEPTPKATTKPTKPATEPTTKPTKPATKPTKPATNPTTKPTHPPTTESSATSVSSFTTLALVGSAVILRNLF